MKRQHLTICLLTSVACITTLQSCSDKKETQKMNVLFLLADDLRWNSLHCMGTDYLITPNIDQLASKGVTFHNAFASTAISCVSRATILTGQYMSRHHITGFGKAIPKEHFKETYPALLRQAGYWTGHVGKYGVGRIRKEDYDYSSIYEGIHWYPKNKKDYCCPVKLHTA